MNANDEFVNEESNESQCSKILAHLKKGLPITQLEALQMFRCFRLASRISDLRKRGENITVERIKTTSGKYVAQYRLAI
ncbi:MAG: helix-turn-helix domain-containing protein [Bacteroidales bacterium]|nr:helix-turn-helix domain-containing protein [Bacteroidales bacterium]